MILICINLNMLWNTWSLQNQIDRNVLQGYYCGSPACYLVVVSFLSAKKKKLTGITHQTGEGGGGHTYFIDLAERTLYLAAMGRIPAGSLQSESGYVTCSGEEIFDWKPIHYVDKDTGEDKTFYYDPKTDQSQWHNPQGIDVPHSFRAHPPPRV
mmetsp:Transcript_14083/g.17457  ORF Transcript_14083/g.17457 Transcript_14083/m.17457 type:complete len:154 (-) Transcript_14083:92-553(-)